MNLDDVAAALLPEQRASDTHVYGSVESVNADGSYEVRLNSSSVTTRCAAGCTAGVGDRVLVCIMANGRCVAAARLEGEYAEFAKHIIMAHNKSIFGTDANGNWKGVFSPCNASGNTIIGYDNYANASGNTVIYGDRVGIFANKDLFITSPTAGLSARAYGVNKVLWSGVYYMSTSQTATLSEAVSKQPNGIVLVWSRYTPSSQTVSNWEMATFFVPKYLVANNLTTGYLCEHRGPGYPMAKYVAISNTTIVGTGSYNDSVHSTNNEDFFNNCNVLRYVIGV